MIELKRTDGKKVRVGFNYFISLRMLMDWQIRQLGYDADDVAAKFRTYDDLLVSVKVAGSFGGTQ